MIDTMHDIAISAITTDRDLYQVGRLRYSVTVEEMNLRMVHADHSRRVVIEPLDQEGHILAAWLGDRVVGTLRTNLLARSNIGAYYDAYAINRFPAQLTSTMSITTRMAIDPQYRKTGLFLRLVNCMYQYFLDEGVTHDVIDCRKRLVSRFVDLGYREHKENLDHPEFGEVTVLSLDVRDSIHLQAVGSHFLELLDAWQRRHQ